MTRDIEPGCFDRLRKEVCGAMNDAFEIAAHLMEQFKHPLEPDDAARMIRLCKIKEEEPPCVTNGDLPVG